MHKNFTNLEIAKLLKSIAAAYIVKNENRFKIAAYEKAAASIEHATSEVKDLWDDNKLSDLAGIGPNIAQHLDELFRTGRVKHFDEVIKNLPEAMFELLLVPGIGPKTAFKLCQSLHLKNKKKALLNLEEAAKKGEIRKIEGFGVESEKDILEGIQAFRKGQTKEKRMLLPYADQLAHEIIDYLKICEVVKRADALGSLRRMVSTIGDIDIAVETTNPKKVIEWFIKYPKIRKILDQGQESLVRVILENGKQIDIRLQEPESYGAMLQYFTGGKAHNISLREFAIKQHKSLSEYGIKHNSRLKKYADELDFYHDLGLEWIPPEIREDTGEIEAALHQAQGKSEGLPSLIKLTDIKGDLHVHSNFPIETSHDDGANSIEEILLKAGELGYEYIGFTEHNPSNNKHSATEITNLLRRKKEVIDNINYSSEKRVNNVRIKGLNGLEIDIKTNGELGIPEKALEYLDFAIVSIHSNFNLSREKMTTRVLKALSNPRVKIFGHPTGRMLNKREGYELDWDEIFDFCYKNNKWLEINAWPERLDLPDSLVREAVKKGVKMVVCTDSHEINQLTLMEYGISVARRGWAEKSDIINTLPLNELIQEIDGRR